MSLEKKGEALIEAVTNLIISVNAMISGQQPATTSAGSGPAEKPTKKDLADLKKAAKAKAGAVLKALSKVKLSELLSEFSAGKFSDLKSEPDIFNAFIEKADAMLEAGPGENDDDLLGDGPADKEYTIEDVKALLLQVNNSKALGRDVTRQILADLGVARLPELKKDKFTAAIEKIEETLKDAGGE